MPAKLFDKLLHRELDVRDIKEHFRAQLHVLTGIMGRNSENLMNNALHDNVLAAVPGEI